MPNNALFLNLSCIFCFVKWGGKWKKCQKKCKKSCFFLQHVPQKLKKYRFRHGLHLLLSRQKWKKTLKKTCFFHVFLHCFFAFCLDLRWTRTFGTDFIYDETQHFKRSKKKERHKVLSKRKERHKVRFSPNVQRRRPQPR